jgi:hypothetical protein
MEPVSTAWSIDGNQSPRSIWCVGLSLCRRQISRFSGVQLNCPHVQDQPLLGQQLHEPHELGHEGTRVLDAEGEDAKVTEGARRRDDAAGPEDQRHGRGHLLPRGRGRRRQLHREVAEGLLDRPRGVQQRAGAAHLVGLQVQAHRGGRGGDGPGVGHRRRVARHQPRLAQFPPDAVPVEVADRHPFLVRRQVQAERADGQRVDPASQAGGRVAAGEPVGVHRDRARDRHAVPVRDLHPDAERRRGHALGDPRDQVLLSLPVRAALHLEREVGDHPGERGGQQVIGVQVAHRVEDPRQLRVEDPFGVHRLRGLPEEPRAQQPQPLHRVHRVHRRLQRQVHVVAFEQQQRLLHEDHPVGVGQHPRGLEEVVQRHRPGNRRLGRAEGHRQVGGQRLVGLVGRTARGGHLDVGGQRGHARGLANRRHRDVTGVCDRLSPW